MRSERKVERMVRGFIYELTAAIEGLANERHRKNIEEFLEKGLRQAPRMRKRRAVNGKRAMVKNPNPRPCAAPGCNGTARPRDGMVCVDHASLPKRRKAILREQAKKPGGVWFKWHAREKRSKAKKVA